MAIIASLLILVILAYRTRGASFRWNLFLATLNRVDWRWLAASIFLILLSYFGRALRWQVMLRPLGRTIGIWRLTSDTLIGATAGLLLGRMGEVVRPYLISVQTGLPISSQAAAWLLERMLDLLAVLLICGYAFIALPTIALRIGPKVEGALRVGGYSLALTGLLTLALLFAFRDPSGGAQRRLASALAFLPVQHQQRAIRMMDAFSRGLECTRSAQSLLILLGYTVLEWAVILVGTLTMFRSFAATHYFGLIEVLVMLAFISLGSLLQLPGVGGGVQAASIIALTRVYGLELEAASGVALLFWFVGSFCVVPFGVLGAFHEGLNWSKLKLLSTKQILDQEA